MRKTLTWSTAILLLSAVLASAQGTTLQGGQSDMSIRTRSDQRPRPQRYVCVVPAPRDAGRSNYVCPADPGRAGGRCRCPNVTGGGSLQPV